ncbi:MAG: hypothetical protein L3J52_03720, partial [Proteobacteria bacterium]|nr:hypothetical protein [Pseudomonadota bacterium]
QPKELEAKFDKPLIDDGVYEIEVTLASNKQPNKINLEVNGKKLKIISATEKMEKHMVYFQVASDYDKKNLNVQISPYEKRSNSTIGLSKFKLKKLKPYELTSFNHDSKILFSGNIKKFHPTGFFKKEKWGRWSIKEQSGLMFSVSKDFCEKGYLQLKINRFYTNVDSKEFQVFINAHKLKLINSIISGRRHMLYYDCSSYYNNPERSAVVNLTFHTDKVVSPSDVSNSRDIRELGAGFASLEFGNLKDMSVE